MFSESQVKSVSVANGEACEISGTIDLPMELEGKVKFLETMVVPSVCHDLILGSDFWAEMGIVASLREGVWNFSEKVQLCSVNDSQGISIKGALQPKS